MDAILFLLGIGVLVAVFALPVIIAVTLSNLRREHEAGLKSLRTETPRPSPATQTMDRRETGRPRGRMGRTRRAKDQSRSTRSHPSPASKKRPRKCRRTKLKLWRDRNPPGRDPSGGRRLRFRYWLRTAASFPRSRIASRPLGKQRPRKRSGGFGTGSLSARSTSPRGCRWSTPSRANGFCGSAY